MVAKTGGKNGGLLGSINVDFPFDEDVLIALAQKQITGELPVNRPKHE